jgi:enhancing lycopene biosynthesis protein 2
MAATDSNTVNEIGFWTGLGGAIVAVVLGIWRIIHTFFAFKTEHNALMLHMAREAERMAIVNDLRASVNAAKEERRVLIEEVRALRVEIHDDVANLSNQLNEAILVLAGKRKE